MKTPSFNIARKKFETISKLEKMLHTDDNQASQLSNFFDSLDTDGDILKQRRRDPGIINTMIFHIQKKLYSIAGFFKPEGEKIMEKLRKYDIRR